MIRNTAIRRSSLILRKGLAWSDADAPAASAMTMLNCDHYVFHPTASQRNYTVSENSERHCAKRSRIANAAGGLDGKIYGPERNQTGSAEMFPGDLACCSFWKAGTGWRQLNWLATALRATNQPVPSSACLLTISCSWRALLLTSNFRSEHSSPVAGPFFLWFLIGQPW